MHIWGGKRNPNKQAKNPTTFVMNFSSAVGVITNNQSRTVVTVLKVIVAAVSFQVLFILFLTFILGQFCVLAIKQNLQWSHCWTSLEIEFYFVTSLWNWKWKSLGRVEKDQINNNNNISALHCNDLIVFYIWLFRLNMIFTVLCLNSCPCQHTVAL